MARSSALPSRSVRAEASDAPIAEATKRDVMLILLEKHSRLRSLACGESQLEGIHKEASVQEAHSREQSLCRRGALRVNHCASIAGLQGLECRLSSSVRLVTRSSVWEVSGVQTRQVER